MRMKKILLRLSCLCVLSSGTLFLRAGDLEQALVLQLSDGSRVVYFLETRPKVTFEDGRLVLSASGMEASYPLDQVRKYTFEMADPTSVPVPGIAGTGWRSGDGRRRVLHRLAGRYRRVGLCGRRAQGVGSPCRSRWWLPGVVAGFAQRHVCDS